MQTFTYRQMADYVQKVYLDEGKLSKEAKAAFVNEDYTIFDNIHYQLAESQSQVKFISYLAAIGFIVDHQAQEIRVLNFHAVEKAEEICNQIFREFEGEYSSGHFIILFDLSEDDQDYCSTYYHPIFEIIRGLME